MDGWAIWNGIAMPLVMAVSIVYQAVSNHNRAKKDELAAVSAEQAVMREAMSAHTSRLTALEEQIKHLPTVAALHEHAQALGKISGDFREMMGEFRGLKNQVANIDDYLRNKGS